MYYGSCLLGSINLTRFIQDPFTENAAFNWDAYRKTIRIFTRMLDNVVEINGLPLEKQREEITSKRRHLIIQKRKHQLFLCSFYLHG
jgi:ribonucleoside-diphosphate reductase alpha chain